MTWTTPSHVNRKEAYLRESGSMKGRWCIATGMIFFFYCCTLFVGLTFLGRIFIAPLDDTGHD